MRKPHRIGSPREIQQIHELWHLGMVATDPHASMEPGDFRKDRLRTDIGKRMGWST